MSYTLEQFAETFKRRGKNIDEPEERVNGFHVGETIAPGDRHDILYRALRSQKARGFTKEAAITACLIENEQKCNPPLPPDEARKHLDRVWHQDDSPAFKESVQAKAADPFPATETGDAEFFARREADNLRYNHRTKAWLVFPPSQHYWRPDADGEVQRRWLSGTRARQQAAIAISGDDDKRRVRVAWTIKGESRSRILNGLGIAQSIEPLSDDGEGWNANPWLLAGGNGVIDLQTGACHAGRHSDRITLASPVHYDPNASTERWAQFVSDICDGDAEQANYLQAVVGYSLTGLTSEQCFWIFYGGGSNGKSTFLEMLMKHILPQHSWSMTFPSQKWSEALDMYQRAELVGRRLVVAKENQQAQRLNSEFMKSLTGDETIQARHPYGRPFNFQPEAKFFLAVNHKPVIRDETHGMWRRVRLVPFTRKFPTNPAFAASLLAEVPGVLTWAVQGAVRYAREGLRTPQSVLVATAEYQQESEALAPFFAECCIFDSKKVTGAQAMYDGYRSWSIDAQVPDEERVSQKEFGLRIRNDTRFTVEQDRSTRRVFYRGAALIERRRGDGEQ